jgi:hypothetical protein
MKAPQCAAIIHTDFEKGFIKAEVVAFKDLVAAGSVQRPERRAKYRLEAGLPDAGWRRSSVPSEHLERSTSLFR